MDRIPILRMGQFLLVTIQMDLRDTVVERLQEDLAQMVDREGAKGVLIDLSAVEMVDSFIARTIARIATTSRFQDAQTVVVGMQPAVAITLVELGLSLPSVRSALDVEQGMDLLRASTAQEATSDDERE